MRLRKECEHGLYDVHEMIVYGAERTCPGGEFVTEKCGTCKGKGKVQISDWANPNCPKCHGSGESE